MVLLVVSLLVWLLHCSLAGLLHCTRTGMDVVGRCPWTGVPKHAQERG